MENKIINEVFWLRAIACLAVTFGHALQNGYKHFTEPSSFHVIAYILYMVILFGVPVFVFISEFLLANKYGSMVPRGFISKRIKILAIPYVFMNIIYAFFDVKDWNLESFLLETGKNIFLAHSTIYFVVIIIQFYFLHISFSKYLNAISGRIALPAAFIINVLYLSVFNFIETPNNSFAIYFWDIGYWMPFAGWIFYFVLGYYCGKSYEQVLVFLRKHNRLVIATPVIFLGIMLLMNQSFYVDQNSKRVDMLLFATSIILLIMYVSSYVKKTPKFIMMISNYSFSIFLLNEFFFLLFLPVSPPEFLNIITYSVVVFFLSLICSTLLSYLVNRLAFGKYLVGNIMSFKIQKDCTINRTA